jgi:hypothetical protein
MTKFDAMFPAVGTPCSDEDVAKEMATLAKGNHGTGKDLTKNLSLATASLEFKFEVINGLTIRNSSGEIEDGNYSSNEIADIFSNNGSVMRCLKDRVQQFDMQDAIMIPKLSTRLLLLILGSGLLPPLTCSRTSRLLLLMQSKSIPLTPLRLTRLMELAVKTSIGF